MRITPIGLDKPCGICEATVIFSSLVLADISTRMGWETMVPFLHYGDKWRKHRQLLNLALNSVVVRAYEPQQARQARLFLDGLLKGDSSFDLEKAIQL